MSKKLTIKQETFAQEVFRTSNQADAYRIVFPGSRNWKDESVWQKASKLMSKVGPRVAELQAAAAKRAEITVDRVLNESAKLASTILPGIVKFDGARMSVADFDSLMPEQLACIQSFKVNTEQVMELDESGKPTFTPVNVVEVKLYSKLAALDKLAEFLGIGKDK
jgi:phage terminase small subunit